MWPVYGMDLLLFSWLHNFIKNYFVNSSICSSFDYQICIMHSNLQAGGGSWKVKIANNGQINSLYKLMYFHMQIFFCKFIEMQNSWNDNLIGPEEASSGLLIDLSEEYCCLIFYADSPRSQCHFTWNQIQLCVDQITLNVVLMWCCSTCLIRVTGASRKLTHYTVLQCSENSPQ